MIRLSGFSGRALVGADEMVSNDCRDEAWQRKNLVEVVRLAALQLHSESGTFTLKALVKLARKFHRNGRLSESLVAGVLAEASVQADLPSAELRLAA